jgi:hypothetical protein
MKGNTTDIKKEVLEKAKKSLAEKVNVESLTNLDLKRIQDTLLNRPSLKQKALTSSSEQVMNPAVSRIIKNSMRYAG